MSRELARTRPGLRARVTATFALGALGVSLLLAFTTYALTSSYVLEQRHRSAMRQAVFNARVVNAATLTQQPAIDDLLDRINARGRESSFSMALIEGDWFEAVDSPGRDVLPEAFTGSLSRGEPVWQRIETPDGLALAVGLPLEGSGGTYVEVFSLREADLTLRTLGLILAGAATATTLLGIGVGLWAVRRALRPLTAVTSAAAAVAHGDLGARLHADDPDLADLAGAFNRTAQDLQERVDRDARFAGNVSHELRSPLTTMVNAVEVLQTRRDLLDEEGCEVLDLLAGDVRRFVRTVSDLLEISSSDLGRASLILEPVRLGQLVRLVADRRAGRPVTHLEPSASMITATVDKRRVERIVEDLVDNAERHGGGATRVTLATAPHFIRLLVEDAGPGVPDGAKEQVFERFYSRDRRGRGEGTGLGLALVQEHAALHGGRVWVEDRPGGGAVFVVELPR